jgi:oligoendopeptidase F
MMDVEWARIPHFYRAFYVYQYATGFCSAVSIADQILETGNPSNYLEFLSLGGSKYPIDELKVAGVDLTKPEPVANALKVFEETLDEFESIVLK